MFALGSDRQAPNSVKVDPIGMEATNLIPTGALSRPHDRADMTISADAEPCNQDDEVIRAFFEGSEPERSRLYEYILPLCRSTIGRMVGRSNAEAEDLLQSAVERIVSTLVYGTFSRRCSLKTWAVAVTRNVVRNEVRSWVRDRHHLTDEDLDTYPAAGELQCSVEQGEVRRVLRRLPDEMALPLVLHDLCGYTAAEVGHKLGLTSAGAQSRIWRARGLARHQLQRGSVSRV